MNYYLKMSLIGALALGILAAVSATGRYPVGSEAYIGIIFLSLLNMGMHAFVVAARRKAGGATIRRIMIASFVRMLLALLFLVITFINLKPVSMIFTLSYCLYFAFLLVYEISEMRSNLRPVSEQGEKIEKA